MFSPTTWKAFEAAALKGRPGKQVAVELGLSVAAVYLAQESGSRPAQKEIIDELENPT